MNKYLEMWKTQRLVSWLDCVFDTCFLAFIWIMGWNIFFWIYVVIATLSSIGNAIQLNKLEGKL